MAGKRRSRIKILGLLALLASPGSACSDSSDPEGTGTSDADDPERAEELLDEAEGKLSFSEKNTLLSLGVDCVMGSYARFQDKADKLHAATQELASEPNDDTLEEAQAAWREAMDAWQHADLYQLGPAGDVGRSILGAQGLRDQIYSWKDSSGCRVDQATVDELYEGDGYQGAVTYRGMDALEYLLFSDHTEKATTACLDSNKIVTEGGWDELVASGDLLKRRAAYAEVIAEDVAQRADELYSQWEDGFLAQFVDAGQRSTYPERQDAFNALYQAMFYMDEVVKDAKLALLEETGCADGLEACLTSNLEHAPSGFSRPAVVRNLDALRDLFVGCGDNALGFNDLLTERGHDDLSEQMLELTDDAISAAESLEQDDLGEAAEEDPEPVVAAWADVQELVALFKSEFAAALELELPAGGPGDND